MKTSAVMDLPRQPIAPPVIHNHNQVAWPGIIATGFLCLVALLPILWWFLVFLFDRLGYRNPEAAVAWWLVVVPLVFIILWMLSVLVGDILDRVFDYKMEIAAMVQETERLRLLQEQSSVDGMRINSQDAPFAKLILAVMHDAYKYGPKGARGEIRWSRRQAYALAKQHNLGLSELQCGRLAGWLLSHNVISEKDQINRAHFDDLGSVKALVSRVYNIPINMVSDIGMSAHHLYGAGKDQWNNPLSPD